MRFFVSAILIFLVVAVRATDVNYLDEIWIDGRTLTEGLSSRTSNTIYFPAGDPAIDEVRLGGNHSIAVQLDLTFDPLPFDAVRLPSVRALSSVSSPEVVDDYLRFLEEFSRTNGISYLVLPDTIGCSAFEKEVIETAAAASPHFYVQPSRLRNELPASKKDFLQHISNAPQILIAPQHANLRKIQRWSSKYLPQAHLQFLAQLEAARALHFTKQKSLPGQLEEKIFRAGAYAMDPMGTLPLQQTELTYLGSNPTLHNWLSKYATVYADRKQGIVTIVDHMSSPDIQTESGDVILTTQKDSREDATQLVFPLALADQEIQMAKMLFGAAAIVGREEAARFVPNLSRMGFSAPEEEDVMSLFQAALDSIGQAAIEQYATPGIQLAVVKNGNLIFEQALGTYTYDSLKPVDSHTIYDVASLTKVMATLPAIGLLLDRNLINLDDSVSQYLPDFAGSNKGRATIRQLLAHNAGLKSYVPFWSMMMDGDRLDAFYYKTQEDKANDVRSYGHQPDPIMVDSLRSYIVKSDLIKNPQTYNYSDLGFMVLHLIVEQVSNQPFDAFVSQEFYRPMGMKSTTFNPLQNGFDVKEIAPTEYDQRFRDYLVWGEVHDRNAAVFGGVSGHAGLFSNAVDLAKMMTMYLNGGVYGGRRYLSSEVLNWFNTRFFQENRRGLGWDKKDGRLDAGSVYASDASFGHTGFTGTMVWADPAQDLIFVFLSNRIYPDASNNRLGEYNIRTTMHDRIYESINSPNQLKLN